MQTRVEGEPTQGLLAAGLLPVQYGGLPDVEVETPFLPRDHPAWMRDAVALSMRARELLAKLKPVAIRVLSFWDHTVRSLTIAGRRLGIDASGSYRLD